jgi:dodecin
VRFVVKASLDLAEVTGDEGVSHVRTQTRGVIGNVWIGQHGRRAALQPESQKTRVVRIGDHLQDLAKRRWDWWLLSPAAHGATVLRCASQFKVFEPSARGTQRRSTTERKDMANIAKVITIIGSSPESFAKAADAAVQEAAKTVRDISGAQVVSMSAEVEGDHISMYRTTVNIAFGVERS